MPRHPRDELLTSERSGREGQYRALRVVDARLELAPVEDEERLQRRVRHALVPIDERVVERQRVAQRRRLLGERRVQLGAGERGARLSDGRLERTEVP